MMASYCAARSHRATSPRRRHAQCRTDFVAGLDKTMTSAYAAVITHICKGNAGESRRRKVTDLKGGISPHDGGTARCAAKAVFGFDGLAGPLLATTTRCGLSADYRPLAVCWQNLFVGNHGCFIEESHCQCDQSAVTRPQASPPNSFPPPRPIGLSRWPRSDGVRRGSCPRSCASALLHS